jgi:hypothetical protein
MLRSFLFYNDEPQISHFSRNVLTSLNRESVSREGKIVLHNLNTELGILTTGDDRKREINIEENSGNISKQHLLLDKYSFDDSASN